MIVAALLLATGAAPSAYRASFQEMTSPAFTAFAARSERICPKRRLRYLHPAELDWLEEGYLLTLPPRRQRGIDAVASRRPCTPAGASCPAQHMLQALVDARLAADFVRFACSVAE